MGDRGNVYVKNHNGEGVYLYSHWGGYDLAETVKRALSRRMRWNDDAYLTRIIFDEMTKGNRDQETGFGISSYMPDNEYQIIVIDCDEQTIAFSPSVDGPSNHRWTFNEYVELEKGALSIAWHGEDDE